MENKKGLENLINAGKPTCLFTPADEEAATIQVSLVPVRWHRLPKVARGMSYTKLLQPITYIRDVVKVRFFGR